MHKTKSVQSVKPNATKENNPSSSSQESYFTDDPRQTLGFISQAEAEALWAKFEADFPAILAKLKSKHPDIDIKQLFIGSFIGRTNPPHDGHIMAIQTVILNALRQEGGSALILLGSGPGKMSNAQNPIPFQLKRLFIIWKLIKSNGSILPELFQNGKINILEMDKPVAQTTRVFSEQVSPDIMHLGNILFVGNKPGDAEKLTFYKTGVGKGVTVDGTYYPIKTSIIPIEPIITGTGDPMSATKVREFVKNNTLDEFRLAFGGFYNIFVSIVFLQQFLSEEESGPFLEKYKLDSDSTLDFARLFYDIILSEFQKETEASETKAVKTTTKAVKTTTKAAKVAEVVPTAVASTAVAVASKAEKEVVPTAVKMEVTPIKVAVASKAEKEVVPTAVKMEVTAAKRKTPTTKVPKNKEKKPNVVIVDTNAGGSRKRRKTRQSKRRKTRRKLTKRKLTKRRKTKRKLIKRKH
jgi:hypothetical protein